MDDKEKVVSALLDKAAAAEFAVGALNYSQAAVNAANAIRVLADMKPAGK